MERPETAIVQKAIECGYESCGIIGVDDVADFADKLFQRMGKIPKGEEFYGKYFRFANIYETYPWARSIIVCIIKYGVYRLPEHLEGLIGKHYLVDVRSCESSKGRIASVEFEKHLRSLGHKIEIDRRYGVTAMRWAALKAGLGVARRNNFFYTDSGSWIHIEAFLTDKEMELKQTPTQEPCPQDCDRCITACPTKSLSEPYTMDPAHCISPLSAREPDHINNPDCRKMGKWIYGCDICQDVCPHNENKWAQTEDFPGLDELGKEITLESIVKMDEERLAGLLASKFFYIEKERIWQWKLNALNAMHNSNDKKYAETIKSATNDTNENVRRMAQWVAQHKEVTT